MLLASTLDSLLRLEGVKMATGEITRVLLLFIDTAQRFLR